MKNSKKNTLLSRLLFYVKPYRKYVVFAVFMAVLAISLTLLNPILIGKAIDNIIGVDNVNFAKVIHYLIYIAVASVTSAFFEWFMEMAVNTITFKTTNNLRQDIFQKFNTVPLKYIDNHAHGDMMNTMINDVENITSGFLSGAQSVFSGVVTIIVTIVIMLSLNVTVSLIVIVLTPLSILIALYINKKSKKLFRQKVGTIAKISAFSEEMIGNQKIIKAFNFEEETFKKFEVLNEELRISDEKATFYATMARPVSRFINGLVYAITGFISALIAIKGRITIGQISSFLNYSQEFAKPFNEITGVFADIQVAIASAHRVFNFLDEQDEISDKQNYVLQKCNGEVKLRNVHFSYDPQFKLIKNLNLHAKKGQKIAIVGPTGCGKTTIINLLMRFYDVNRGSIKVSNQDIRKLTRPSFRSFYGMVLQDSWLYSATVAENIAYGKPDATREEIVQAAKLANANQFIERMEKGYDTIISERADNISAGQKQLICIARIMLIQPPMIILDEATSSTDTLTEIKIQEAFDEMMKGRTCFVVAHRLSTIINSDLILVMNNGNVIEQGTHEELMAKNGFYYELFNSQFAN